MKRDFSLDALRGMAILGMVLSGMIQHNPELPAWLFHAQVGPRSGFAFDASCVGITWVDLIFPMFLFAMGGAMSFSLARSKSNGDKTGEVFRKLIVRTLKLFLFALVVRQLHPYSLNAGLWGWGYALIAFVSMTAAFAKLPLAHSRAAMGKLINRLGILLLVVMLVSREWIFDKPFSLSASDIIILVLANVSLVGGVIYWFTCRRITMRVIAVGIIAAMFITVTESGSWNAQLWNFSLWKLLPSSFFETSLATNLGIKGGSLFINISFWKYLIIVLLGSVVGDYAVRMNTSGHFATKGTIVSLALLSAAVVVCNTTLLYMRDLWLNLFINGVLCGVLLWQTKKVGHWLGAIIKISVLILVFGLILEAHSGGIRKDFSTIGYLVLTTSLSSFIMLFFNMLSRIGVNYSYVAKIGQNPLVGYVAAAYVVLPLLALSGLLPLLDGLHTQVSEWFAVLRGVVITAAMAIVTIWMVDRKIIFKI